MLIQTHNLLQLVALVDRRDAVETSFVKFIAN